MTSHGQTILEYTTYLNFSRRDIQVNWNVLCQLVSLNENYNINDILFRIDPNRHSFVGLLPDTQHCGLSMRRECRERSPRHWLQRKPLISDHGMHHGTCHAYAAMHVGIANPRWRGKCSRHSRCMRNPQCYVSDKSPIEGVTKCTITRDLLIRIIHQWIIINPYISVIRL